jgi:hypothetical protein
MIKCSEKINNKNNLNTKKGKIILARQWYNILQLPFVRRATLQENCPFSSAKIIFNDFTKNRRKKANFRQLGWADGK